MLFPLISADEWSKKYKIDIKKFNCKNCGKEMILNIPFAQGKIRGFITNHNECGKEYQSYTYVNMDNDINLLILNIKDNLKGDE